MTQVQGGTTCHLSMISSPIALNESPPGNGKWGNRYVSGPFSVTPDSWFAKVQMMTLKFPFSPFTLHLGDTTPLPGETDDKYDVNDIAPSLIPVRDFLDDHSWTSFILPIPSQASPIQHMTR